MAEEAAPPVEAPEIVFLRECGEALFGSTWQTELARELSERRQAKGGKPVDVATVRRWVRGAYKPQPWVWLLIGVMLRDRAARQRELYDRLTMKPMWDSLTK